MDNNKLGLEPAFPNEQILTPANLEFKKYQNSSLTIMFPGMSKRFYAACAAMQGLISANSIFEPVSDPLTTWNSETIVEKAYEIADELLKQENE